MSEVKTCRNKNQKPWSFRRKVVISTLSFCAGVIGFITAYGHDNEVIGAAIVGGAFTLATAVIGSYIFGAVWHDKGDKDA
jgi:hypothetical protein